MSRTRSLSVLFVALALVAAACSSGSGNSDKSGGSTATDSADLTLAKQAVLRPSDLSDYKATTHIVGSELSSTLRRTFAQCMGVDTTIFDTVPNAQIANSPDFSKGQQNQQQVTSSVEIDPTAADVDQGWKDFSGAKTQSCLKDLFGRLYTAANAAKAGIKYGPVHVSEFNVGVGDRSIGYAMSRAATGPAQTIELDVDVIYVVHDRAGMEFNFFNYGTNPDRTAEARLAQKVYDRVGDKAA